VIVCVTPNPCVDRTLLLPRLARGEVNLASSAQAVAGGKGNNVARVLTSFGEEVRAVMPLGGPTGALVAELLRVRDGIEPTVVPTERETREVVTLVEGEGKTLTALFEPTPQMSGAEAGAFAAAVTDAARGADVVCICGSVMAGETEDLYARLVAAGRSGGAKVILDGKGRALSSGLRARPDAAKLNADEVADAFGSGTSADDALAELEGIGIGWSVISLGESGAVASHDGARYDALPPPVSVVNPVASGDAMTAGLALAIRRGMAAEDALRLAAGCGAANAERMDACRFSAAEAEALAARVTVRKRGEG